MLQQRAEGGRAEVPRVARSVPGGHVQVRRPASRSGASIPSQAQWQTRSLPMVNGRNGSGGRARVWISRHGSGPRTQRCEAGADALPFTMSRSIGPVMLRSEDGERFEVVSKPGLGTLRRFLVPLPDAVQRTGVHVAGRQHQLCGQPVQFPPCSDPMIRGEGSGTRRAFRGSARRQQRDLPASATFNGHLYAGTFNSRQGISAVEDSRRRHAAARLAQGHRSGALRGNRTRACFAARVQRALYVGM